MAIEQRSVSIAKESDDVMKLVVGVVAHFKSGKGVSEATELLDELMNALSGVDQVDDEWKENRQAVFNSVLLGAAEIVDVLVSKKEDEVPSGLPE